MNVARYTLPSDEWGEVMVLRPIPNANGPWGDMALLEGTPWGDLITHVSGEAMSHALHGFVTPLMREIGPHPHRLARRVPAEYRECAIHAGCALSTSECHPGPTLPGCYVPPLLTPEVRQIAAVVAAAWQEGRYVVIVEGPEFSL